MFSEFRTWIKQHNLQMPAAIFVETFRPLHFMFGQVLGAVAPLVPGMAAERWRDLEGLGDGNDGASSPGEKWDDE